MRSSLRHPALPSRRVPRIDCVFRRREWCARCAIMHSTCRPIREKLPQVGQSAEARADESPQPYSSPHPTLIHTLAPCPCLSASAVSAHCPRPAAALTSNLQDLVPQPLGPAASCLALSCRVHFRHTAVCIYHRCVESGPIRRVVYYFQYVSHLPSVQPSPVVVGRVRGVHTTNGETESGNGQARCRKAAQRTWVAETGPPTGGGAQPSHSPRPEVA